MGGGGWWPRALYCHLLGLLSPSQSQSLDNLIRTVETTLKIAGKVAPFFDGELHRLRMMMMNTKQKLDERRRLRDELKSENSSLKA